MTVGIVTDSSACLPTDLAEQHGVRVVAINVSMAGAERPVDQVARSELLRRLDAGGELHTSAPSPGQFLEAVEDADDGDGVVVLTLAASMSATHDAATLAASTARVAARVVDSGTAAGGHGLIALAAARAAADGGDLDAVVARCSAAADRVRLIAAVGSLEYLTRSGRVPALAGKAGDALGVRPMFEFRRGEPRVLIPSLSREASLDRLLARWRDARPSAGGALHVTALHADDRGSAEWLLKYVSEDVDPQQAFISEFDVAMLVHTGPDLVGLAWWWD